MESYQTGWPQTICYAAGSDNGNGGDGGNAGQVVVSSYSVTPGDVLYIIVGQGGRGGSDASGTLCNFLSNCGIGGAGARVAAVGRVDCIPPC